MGYMNHLIALEQAALNHPNNAVFKIPNKGGSGWKDVSYKVFWDDITRFAVHWRDKLKPKCDSQAGPSKREVVGLWMIGKTYVDVVHLFSLQRAGFVPHLMSTYLQDISLVQDLFNQSGARIILCDVNDAGGWERLAAGGFEIIPLHDSEPPVLSTTSNTPITLDVLPALDGDLDDILTIEQSSGSSSGRPKIVPYTRRWMDATAQKCQNNERRTPVFIRTDSFCYAPQIINSLRMFLYADCVVLTNKIFWKQPDDLANIIAECGVTDMALYPTLVSDILHKAKDSPNLLEKLRSLQSLNYGGGPLDERTIELAKELGIPVATRFVNTEVGLVMLSQPGTPHLLRFFRRLDYKFVPIPGNTHSNIQELVVLPTSPDCPHPSLRNPEDGMYYTKDLFERVQTENSADEVFIFRGRKDDIIIMEEASNCDAKYLEDRIRYLCHDILSKLVVVGSGRPSPALLVEPINEPQDNDTKTSLHNLLVTRLESFFSSSKLYPHEVIKPEYIIALPKGSLPISSLKGRVLRHKVEENFKELLDRVYAGDSVWNDERM